MFASYHNNLKEAQMRAKLFRTFAGIKTLNINYASCAGIWSTNVKDTLEKVKSACFTSGCSDDLGRSKESAYSHSVIADLLEELKAFPKIQQMRLEFDDPRITSSYILSMVNGFNDANSPPPTPETAEAREARLAMERRRENAYGNDMG